MLLLMVWTGFGDIKTTNGRFNIMSTRKQAYLLMCELGVSNCYNTKSICFVLFSDFSPWLCLSHTILPPGKWIWFCLNEMLSFESQIITSLISYYYGLLIGLDFVGKSEVKRHLYYVKNQGQATLKCFHKEQLSYWVKINH